jgi:D-glycero-D-manno-heptose 1,7-bisphosphate phosphatase
MRATVSQCVVRVAGTARHVAETARHVVDGRSVLGWVMRELSRFGVTDFLLLTDRLPADVPAGLPHPARIRLAEPAAGTGTGGALFGVREQLHDRFLLCDGGTLFDRNLASLLADAACDPPEVTGRLLQAAPDGDATGGPMANTELAVFRNTLVDHLRPVCSLEADILPDLIARGAVRITKAAVPLIDRLPGDGPPGEVTPVRLRRRALFLDRDGVLNVDHGYVGSADRFEWVDGALDAIRHATDAGWHVFVVTNQSGVARGLFSEADVRVLLDWVADEARRAGGTIDDVRYCPFHPDATLPAYRQAHPWRKPMPGMLLDLMRAWELDPRRSLMVGDQPSDMAAAAAAGIGGHLFGGGNLLAFLRPLLDIAG